MKLALPLALLVAFAASKANAAPPLNLRQAQEMMANLGIYTGTIDGTMTAETRTAL